jgi:hypothetical protein
MSLAKGTNRREFIVQAGITALGTSVAWLVDTVRPGRRDGRRLTEAKQALGSICVTQC